MIRATAVTGAAVTGDFIAEAWFRLLIEVYVQAIRDARSHTNAASQALVWLNDPQVREMAHCLDIELPRITADRLRANPYPERSRPSRAQEELAYEPA